MKTQKKIIPIFTCIIALQACMAATSDTNPERPTVTKAFDLFEKYPEKIPQGTIVTFKKKETKIAAKIFDTSLQARIFALDDNELRPKPVDTKDDCNIYISHVYPLVPSNKGELVLQKLDEGWLNPTASGKSIKDGRYYIVFEKSGPTQEQFGIRVPDTDGYFETGFLLVVSDDGHANLERVLLEYERRKSKLTTLTMDIDNLSRKIPCYRYTKYAQSGELINYEMLIAASCEFERNIN